MTRNIVPSPSFHKTSWDVTQPNTAAQVMGAYYPTGTYMSKAQFQKKFGCPGAKNKNKG